MRKTPLGSKTQRFVNEDGSPTRDLIRLLNEIIGNRRISTGPAQPLTISGGIVTIGSNFSYLSIDTEAAGASDDLDTINGGNEGDVLFVKAANAAHTVILKDGTGNILCTGSVDLSLDNSEDLALLHFDGANWKANLWNISA